MDENEGNGLSSRTSSTSTSPDKRLTEEEQLCSPQVSPNATTHPIASQEEKENEVGATADGRTNGTCIVHRTQNGNMSVDNEASDASPTGPAAGPTTTNDNATEPCSEEATNALGILIRMLPQNNSVDSAAAADTTTHDSPCKDDAMAEGGENAVDAVNAETSDVSNPAADRDMDTRMTHLEMGVGAALAAMGGASPESTASFLADVQRNLGQFNQVPAALVERIAAAAATGPDEEMTDSDCVDDSDTSDDSYLDNAASSGMDTGHAADFDSSNIEETGQQDRAVGGPRIVDVSSSAGPVVVEASAALGSAARKKKRSAPPVRDGQSAGRWTNAEHESFLEGLKVFGREWKKVALRIPTRTSAQVRSHAQKYFAKLQRDESMIQQEQQSSSLESSSGAATAAAGGGISAAGATAAQSYPPSVQRNVERILANPEQAQRDVENTLLALRERYRQLQRRLQEYPPSPPGQRPVVEDEPEEEKRDEDPEEASHPSEGEEGEQQEEHEQPSQPLRALAAATAAPETHQQPTNGSKRRRGESEGSSSTASALSNLEREELIAVSVLGGALGSAGSPHHQQPPTAGAGAPERPRRQNSLSDSSSSNGDLAEVEAKPPAKETGSDEPESKSAKRRRQN